METPENVQFVQLCLIPRVHFGVQFTSPMCPFSWVQFHPLMGQKMGQKWVRKNKVLKKVQKIRRFHQKSADFWSEWRDLNPRPLGPEPSALPTALHPDMSASKSFPCPRDSVVYYTEFFGRCQVWKWVSHLNLNLPGNRGTRKSCPPALLFLSESPVTLSFCLSGPGR